MDRVQYSLFEHGPFCFRTFPNKVLSVERLVERLFSVSPSILSSTMANATGKNDNFRRTWDRDEYEKKAKERVQELEDDEDDESSSKGRPSAPVKRELLKRREYDVDLEVNLGKSVVITKTTPLSHTGGYYCNVCDCVVKDSVNFLDHINGKKHQRNLGMSMKVERSSLDQVKRRFELNKRKREEEKQKKDKYYDLEERMAVLREEEEQRKQQRKIARKEKKQKTAAVDDGEIDPDLAATMGFAGFGSSKK